MAKSEPSIGSKDSPAFTHALAGRFCTGLDLSDGSRGVEQPAQRHAQAYFREKNPTAYQRWA